MKELAAKIKIRASEVEKEIFQTALKEMWAVAKKLGVTIDDVLALHSGKSKKTTTKAAPKYANPYDPTQTRTGRGRNHRSHVVQHALLSLCNSSTSPETGTHISINPRSTRLTRALLYLPSTDMKVQKYPPAPRKR